MYISVGVSHRKLSIMGLPVKGEVVLKTYCILIILLSRAILGAGCPSVCTCDNVMYEVRCVGRSLSSVPNDLPTETKSLILQYNSIVFTETSSNTTFETLAGLKVLDLSWNKIGAIPLGLLDPLVDLVELHLENNDISTINWRMFYSLKSLKRLYLNWNQISKMHIGVSVETTPSQSFGLHLELLHLNNNKLETLANDTFSIFSSIDSLYLQNNAIKAIEKSAFNGTTVRYLNLGANRLIPENFNLGEVSGLQELVVYGNMLTLDSSDTLAGLTSLRVLSMSHNHVTTISKNSFKDLVNLKELYLEGNNVIIDSLLDEISNITDLIALGLTSDTLVDFPYWLCDLYKNLSVVHITHSNISSITRELSSKCPKLQTLNLKLNMISYIEPMAFANISFRYLHLQMNKIKTIPENTFSTSANLPGYDMELFLDLNPLVCDCHLAHVLELPPVYKVTGKCAAPADMVGTKLSSANATQFVCPTTTLTEPQTTTVVDTTTVTEPQTTAVVDTTTVAEPQTTTVVDTTTVTEPQTTTVVDTTTVTEPQTTTVVDTTTDISTTDEYTTTVKATTVESVTTQGENLVTTDQSTVYDYMTTTDEGITTHGQSTVVNEFETTTRETEIIRDRQSTSSRHTTTQEKNTTIDPGQSTTTESYTPAIAQTTDEVTTNQPTVRQTDSITTTGEEPMTQWENDTTYWNNETTGTPKLQTVIISDPSWRWAAYLAGGLFAALLLLVLIASICFYQHRRRSNSKGTRDNEENIHKGENGLTNGHVKTNGEQATIYIMEDDQVRIPTLEKNTSFKVERQCSISSNNNSHTEVDNSGISDVHSEPQTTINASNGEDTSHRIGSKRRKQSKEELKPMETVDRKIEDYVLVSGVTEKTTHF